MAVLLTIIALVLLLVFIAWDRRHLAKSVPSERSGSQASLAPKSDGRALGYTGIALMVAVMAAKEFAYPGRPPFTGRWAFVYEFAHSFGPYGLAIYWSLLAAAFTLAGLISWRRKGRT